MTTLVEIRNIGICVANENNILDSENQEKVSLSQGIITDFINRVKDDLFEFNTLEQFDHTYQNLFNRAFMYVFGRGAESAFFLRLGNDVERISYDFHKAMKGVCAERLPEHVLLSLNRKSSIMIEMYLQMFQCTKGSQDKMISEEITFQDCIFTILSGAFYYGFLVSSEIELTVEDYKVEYEALNDNPYDYETYDKTYNLDDFKIVNYTITNR